MGFVFDAAINAEKKVAIREMESYLAFRMAKLKPTSEDVHLRHIFRFYLARAMSKMNYEPIFILPTVSIGGQDIKMDVAALNGDKVMLAICEPEHITPETEAVLELFKDEKDLQVLVLHSQYGKPGKVAEKFAEQIANKTFRILAVVPPPFDDAYEYDIWMFETTFRELFSRE